MPDSPTDPSPDPASPWKRRFNTPESKPESKPETKPPAEPQAKPNPTTSDQPAAKPAAAPTPPRKVAPKLLFKNRPDPAADPPEQRRALSNRGGDIRTRGDKEHAQLLADAWRVADTAPTDEHVHGFHTYPARMHPALPATLIPQLLHDPAASVGVLDPFCGGGTVVVEARRLGHRAIGTDLNPLAVRLTRLKVSMPTERARANVAAAAQAVSEASIARVEARTEVFAKLPGWALSRYQPHVLKELAGLLEELRKAQGQRTVEALELVFSAMVVKFSEQRGDTSRQRRDATTIGKGVPSRFFARKTAELCERWETYAALVPNDAPPARVTEADARELRHAVKAPVELVFTSPPYGGTYDYLQHHELRLAWLNLNASKLAQGEIGARRDASPDHPSHADHAARPGGKAHRRPDRHAPRESVREWDRQLSQFFVAIGSKLARRGRAVVVLGDAQLGERRVAADEQVAALAERGRMRLVAAASQARTDYTGRADRREHLLLLERLEGPQPQRP